MRVVEIATGPDDIARILAERPLDAEQPFGARAPPRPRRRRPRRPRSAQLELALG